MKPTVAVIIPCYNNATYVGAAIDSVLRQTRPADEILVVDDGSTDASAEIVAGFHDAVHLIRQSNAGRAAAMNHALAETRCDLIGVIDADDLWWPKLLEKNVAALMDANAALAYCQGLLCDERGKDLGRLHGAPMQDHNVMRCMLIDNHVFNTGCVCRADVVRNAGGYDGRFWPCDDYHLWLRIAARAKIVYQPEPLARYRVHGGQASRRHLLMARKKLDAKLDALRLHPQIVRALGRRFVRQATEDRFYDVCMTACHNGGRETARELITHYVRRFPHRPRGWWQLARTFLPWRLYARLARSSSKANQLRRGVSANA